MGLGMAASAAGGAITRNTALNNAHSQRPRATAPSRRPSAVSTASTKRRMRPPSTARWCRHSRWPANGARRPGRQQHSRHHQAEHLRPFRWRYPASGRERVQGRFGRTPSTLRPTKRRTPASSEPMATSCSTRTLRSRVPCGRSVSATAMPTTRSRFCRLSRTSRRRRPTSRPARGAKSSRVACSAATPGPTPVQWRPAALRGRQPVRADAVFNGRAVQRGLICLPQGPASARPHGKP
jgi:hypothetical protein